MLKVGFKELESKLRKQKHKLKSELVGLGILQDEKHLLRHLILKRTQFSLFTK